MAIFHATIKSHSRKPTNNNKGSLLSIVAYRCGIKIRDEKLNLEFDFSKKSDVRENFLVFSKKFEGAYLAEGGRIDDIPAFWATQDKKELKVNSNHSREWELALPCELSREQQRELAEKFAVEFCEIHDVAGSVSVHNGRKKRSKNCDVDDDIQNNHCHFLYTTRDSNGDKTRQFNDHPEKKIVTEEGRLLWENLCNAALKNAGSDARVSRLSNADRGITEAPGYHTGPNERDWKLSSEEHQRRKNAAKKKHDDRLKKINERKLQDSRIFAIKQAEIEQMNDVLLGQRAIADQLNYDIQKKRMS
ncbi:MobA/MobL family protein [Chitinibacter sp. FCG-7]|uniref:MobA/MobL family protein n=1 Tax=Chitinibacter mangrovi TaxID=3153927 RepID=A0AAU7FBZ8_9NEIS